MPSLETLPNEKLVKFALIGVSGAGKTGALTSLVEAGYKLRIIDFDEGLETLLNYCKRDNLDLSLVQYQSYRDKVKMSPTGPRLAGTPKAYANAMQALDRWPDDDSNPAEWGPDHILVIDSLTNVGRAAFQWARHTNPSAKDPRQWYSAAQQIVEDLVANLTSPDFKTNVIVISHIEYSETETGLRKGFMSSIGKALGPKLPRFFNTLILSETKGAGANVKHVFKTVSTAAIDLKNPAPFRFQAEYPIETAMIDIFKELQS